tara:strand:+ start:2021 stop:2863 length:843 start_codon:yes stop_codon:yes gene_type:complete
MGIITDIFLPLALAFIMFSLGLSLTSADFYRVINKPKDFFVGAFLQLIILPLIGFILIIIWPNLTPELAIGLMIIAAAPGGATSNILTFFAKGDVALSISLTAIISLLCVFTIPIIVLTSAEYIIGTTLTQNISLFDIAIKMFLIVTIPVFFGMFLRKWISPFENLSKKISTLLFVLVLLGAIISERENIILYFSQAGLITLILNLIMMFIAFYTAHFFASGKKQKRSITIECGLQNGTLAIVVATSIFGGGAYLIPAATYSLIMFATSLIFIFLIKKSI